MLTFQEEASPIVDRQREGLLAIILDAGSAARPAVDGLGCEVALVLGFSVGTRARHIGFDDHVYDRLTTLSPEKFPHLVAVAPPYASHWSDRAFELGPQAILVLLYAARA